MKETLKNNYAYQLQPRGKKHTCPSCNSPRSFKRYIRTRRGKEVADECGRCDHENRCGYHLTPKDYYRDHPDARQQHWLEDTDATLAPPSQAETKAVDPPAPMLTIPPDYVTRSLSTQSVLCRWLEHLPATPEALSRTCQRYLLGATRTAQVIYWQIDTLGRVRTGKIMTYSPDGHRQGHPSWVHTRLQNLGVLPGSHVLQQCFFGEHLLADNDATVMLVESEKTALVGDLFYPQYVWLATGGCGQLSAEKLQVLIGRRLVVLPDSGCLSKWGQVLDRTPGLQYVLCDAFEAYPPNTDMADLLVAALQPAPSTADANTIVSTNNYGT